MRLCWFCEQPIEDGKAAAATHLMTCQAFFSVLNDVPVEIAPPFDVKAFAHQLWNTPFASERYGPGKPNK